MRVIFWSRFIDFLTETIYEICTGHSRSILSDKEQYLGKDLLGARYSTPFNRKTLTVNPFPNDKFLDSSKLKEFADDNLKFDGNGGKFSERIGKTVGKEEIARHEQFLLFRRYFQKTCGLLHICKNLGLFGKGLTV